MEMSLHHITHSWRRRRRRSEWLSHPPNTPSLSPPPFSLSISFFEMTLLHLRRYYSCRSRRRKWRETQSRPPWYSISFFFCYDLSQGRATREPSDFQYRLILLLSSIVAYPHPALLAQEQCVTATTILCVFFFCSSCRGKGRIPEAADVGPDALGDGLGVDGLCVYRKYIWIYLPKVQWPAEPTTLYGTYLWRDLPS